MALNCTRLQGKGAPGPSQNGAFPPLNQKPIKLKEAFNAPIKRLGGRDMWHWEGLIWGVVNSCSKEILSGSCRTDLLSQFCPSIRTDYHRASRSHARDREAADRGDAGGQSAGNSTLPWRAMVSRS